MFIYFLYYNKSYCCLSGKEQLLRPKSYGNQIKKKIHKKKDKIYIFKIIRKNNLSSNFTLLCMFIHFSLL